MLEEYFHSILGFLITILLARLYFSNLIMEMELYHIEFQPFEAGQVKESAQQVFQEDS